MTSQPPAGRPADRVRLGIAGLGAVAQAVAVKAKATGVGESEDVPGFVEQDTASHVLP